MVSRREYIGSGWAHIVLARVIERQCSPEGDQEQSDDRNKGANGCRRHSLKRQERERTIAGEFTVNLACTFAVFKPGRKLSRIRGPEQKPAWPHTRENDNDPLIFSRGQGG